MFGIPEWAIGVGFIIVVGSAGRALLGWFLPADQLRGRRASKRDLAQALEEMRKRVGAAEAVQSKLGDVEDLQRRLGEVEERLDFAERLLAKQRDAERLVPPRS